MMRRGRFPGALAAVALAALLSGCSGAQPAPIPPAGVDLKGFDGASGNGLWLGSSDAIRAELLGAVRDAGPVHVTGAMTELVTPDEPTEDAYRGRTLSIDYRGRAGAFDARVRAGDQQVRVVASDGEARIRGDADWAAATGAPETADAVVCTVGAGPLLERLAPLLAPADLVAALLDGQSLSVAEPAGDGDTLQVVVGTEDAALGVLVVERFGAPLPRTFTAADGSGDGSFAFEGWGESPDLEASLAELPCSG
ncbi:hypothetical protein FLP10_12395 [Agromyces intestinalis]|uniref:Lipoprotein n=1 Tax=Agromyces intestinalis TaxID=2592652 RepID=A0A5C1YJW5_9MICO|nr:hypothetical protein [Agromyces intestinalis]QEO15122.1 hypothetical protein FLP10_12395 [Agromyces intestinalis]